MTGMEVTAIIRRRIPIFQHQARTARFAAEVGLTSRGLHGYRFTATMVASIVVPTIDASALPVIQTGINKMGDALMQLS